MALVKNVIPRKQLALELKALLPRTWKIIDSFASVDDVQKTVVRLKQLSIERLKSAPIGMHSISFVVTVSAPNQSTQAGEDKLDDQVNELIHAIDEQGIAWTEARKVIDGNRIAYDINLSITSRKD